ncbi:UDP-N-acetylenolpyruvoylglucosamine reductase [Pseudochryseolinea flava]|uniref:UDP-N-acetylenolpyruvoylglucosamine reductase n=2 Tax=Pseudochryseolinea flava TaxID=2059302 RepID=A0A364XYY8_9BACT|nr:UDP-N-acetylenolpyruvoylglucosamine reductase [Pseudochryseolinea flava]
MPTIQQNIDLLPYNTFKIQASAKHFTEIRSEREAIDLFTSEIFNTEKHLFLGGGSNILLTKDFDGIVVRNAIKGVSVVSENESNITLKVGAGENWHDFVCYCVDKNYGGIENLSLIPGTVGAAPMQNIGAYGVEIKESIDYVEAIQINTGKKVIFSKEQCEFGYRESIFKQKVRDQYFISSVTLTLTKDNHHHFNITYGAIADTLTSQGHDLKALTVKKISDAVIAIRQSKLPDPKVIGNAGSFFKNPSVSEDIFVLIKQSYVNVPSFPGENGLIKIPGGWLIEQSGWKGKTFDNIGVHKQQALVLVNYGGGNGEKIWELAMEIQKSVREKFNIILHPEVNVI